MLSKVKGTITQVKKNLIPKNCKHKHSFFTYLSWISTHSHKNFYFKRKYKSFLTIRCQMLFLFFQLHMWPALCFCNNKHVSHVCVVLKYILFFHTKALCWAQKKIFWHLLEVWWSALFVFRWKALTVFFNLFFYCWVL